jgi:hypothetical protein
MQRPSTDRVKLQARIVSAAGPTQDVAAARDARRIPRNR